MAKKYTTLRKVRTASENGDDDGDDDGDSDVSDDDDDDGTTVCEDDDDPYMLAFVRSLGHIALT